MTKNKAWATEELDILKNEYMLSSIEEMIELLPGRTKHAIQWKASQMGLLVRNGKQVQANHKIIANITEKQSNYLKKKRNHSRIIREAIELYISIKES